jgi:hypothetical protein
MSPIQALASKLPKTIPKLGRKALAIAALAISMSAATAGTEKSFSEIKTTSEDAWWNASLATGWDSLYMFRGVNQLSGFRGYGSSISWTSAAVTFNLTPNDSVELGTWGAFGLSESDYKEIDGTAVYTRTLGDFSFSFGYALYAVLNQTNGLYAHELSGIVSYSKQVGPVTLTPSVEYDFNLGPAPGNRGYVEQCSSYLQIRLDAEMAVIPDRVSVASWTAMGVNFRYNTTGNEEPAPFTGADHVEAGLALPIQLTPAINLTPYVSASYQWQDLIGTRPLTFWGGAAVTFSF